METLFRYIAASIPEITRRITEATLQGQAFQTSTPLPYHDNRLEFYIPLEKKVEIKITLTRTRAGRRIQYHPDTILAHYRRASITIGERGANRNYHVNVRYFKGEIVPLKCDLKMVTAIDHEHHAFPMFEWKSVHDALQQALASAPVVYDPFPTAFYF
jgi:hypothetical protein